MGTSDFSFKPVKQTNGPPRELGTGSDDRLALRGPEAPLRPAVLSSPGYGSLLDYWRTLTRNKLVLVSFAAAGLAAAILISLAQTPIYRARTTIEIQNFNDDFMDLKTVDPTNSNGNNATESYLATQMQIMQSDSLLQRVIEKLNIHSAEAKPSSGLRALIRRALGRPAPQRVTENEALVAQAASHLNVRASGNTHLVEVLYDSSDPKLAAQFANAVVTEFTVQSQEMHWESTQQTGELLTTHLSDLKSKLEQSEQELQNYARTSGLTFTADNQNVAQTQLKQLQDELAQAQADRVVKQSRFEEAQKRPADSLPETLDDGLLRDDSAKLTDLKRQLAELSATLTPANYKVQRVQAQIDELQAAVKKQSEQILHRISDEYEAARLRERLLTQSYAEQQRLVGDQSNKEIHYQTLKGEVDSNRQIYESSLQRIKQAELASAMRASNVLVVDAAKPPLLPYEPNFQMNSAIGLFCGMFLGVGFVLARGHYDRTILSPGDTQGYLNLPELGTIPLELSNTRTVTRDSLPAGSQFALGPLMQDGPELATWKRKMSLLAECFRATLTSILLPDQNGHHPQVILLTSPSPGDGKTTVVSNLGIAIAEIGRKVLIVDGDLRRPRMHQVFGIPNNRGLNDVLSLSDNVLRTVPIAQLVHETKVSGMFLLPSGTISTAPSSLFYSSRMSTLMERLKTEFDMILIDAPPLIHLADARVLGRLSDGVVLVFRAGKTTLESALFASQRFAEDGTHVLGTILNNWDPRNSNGYGYGYGNYEYREYSGVQGSKEK